MWPFVAADGVPYALPNCNIGNRLSLEVATVALAAIPGVSMVAVFGLSYDTVYWNVILLLSLVTFNW
ncbi:hypothetical protein MUA26_00740 [Staphylococcus sp. IVB6246]|uniref:hypothetical protein n=1 Tax=Staphylococcus sp. IVB6246 TaxID=2989772 RepID=UPI0021CEFCED|nr:hypothetical protein [Staphylococcus sp. IVB6246]UXR69725.1 hypothetical protein MUA26_00740 [Staphylococcus sp. IVB6246]